MLVPPKSFCDRRRHLDVLSFAGTAWLVHRLNSRRRVATPVLVHPARRRPHSERSERGGSSSPEESVRLKWKSTVFNNNGADCSDLSIAIRVMRFTQLIKLTIEISDG